MLHQFQCQTEGTLFYYRHQGKLPAHIVEFCPVCGAKDVGPTGRTFPDVNEHQHQEEAETAA